MRHAHSVIVALQHAITPQLQRIAHVHNNGVGNVGTGDPVVHLSTCQSMIRSNDLHLPGEQGNFYSAPQQFSSCMRIADMRSIDVKHNGLAIELGKLGSGCCCQREALPSGEAGLSRARSACAWEACLKVALIIHHSLAVLASCQLQSHRPCMHGREDLRSSSNVAPCADATAKW